MITARKVLSAFYVNQGLKGGHFRKALRHDMRSLRIQGGKQRVGRGKARGGGIVNCGFAWDNSKEGAMYWAKRSMFYRLALEARQSN